MEVTSTVASSSALTTGDSFTVEFTGVYGDVPLLTARPASRATVMTVTQGDAPFRKEIQAFSCSADSAGDFLVTWRGLGNVTVGAEDDLDSFENAISAGLTNVTVAGIDTATICSGEMVYVTFQEVCSSTRYLRYIQLSCFELSYLSGPPNQGGYVHWPLPIRPFILGAIGLGGVGIPTAFLDRSAEVRARFM